MTTILSNLIWNPLNLIGLTEISAERIFQIFGFLEQMYGFEKAHNKYANTVEFHHDNIIIVVKLKLVHNVLGLYHPVLLIVKHQYYIKEANLVFSAISIDDIHRLINGGGISVPKQFSVMIGRHNSEEIYLSSARKLFQCIKRFPQLNSLGVLQPMEL